jgi:hypothetical protein
MRAVVVDLAEFHVPTRRKFLESAAVVSAAPLAPKVVFANGTQRAMPMCAIFDSRHPGARMFGLRAEHLGVPIRAIQGDITDLWLDELEGRWKSANAAIAGLTERPALFMLEQLGWDYGLRVVYQAEHEANDERSAQHHIVRSSLSSLGRQLDAAGASWPAVLADQVLTAAEQVASPDVTPSGAAMAAYLHEPTKLYSWIIAPKTAVASI